MWFSTQHYQKGGFLFCPWTLGVLSHCSGVWLSVAMHLQVGSSGCYFSQIWTSELSGCPEIGSGPGGPLTWACGGFQRAWDPLEMLTLVCVYFSRISFYQILTGVPKVKIMNFRPRGEACTFPLHKRAHKKSRCGLPGRGRATSCYLTPRALSLPACIPYLLLNKFFVFTILPLKNLFTKVINTLYFLPLVIFDSCCW